MSLERLRRRLEARLPEFAGLGYRVAFDLGEEGVLALDGTQSPATLAHEAGEAACTIRVSAEDLEKLIAGSLNPTLAYTLGRLKVEGSLGVAMKMASLLEE